MQIINQQLWDEGLAINQDSYGQIIYRYAERWANAMEEQLAAGEDLSAIAQKTSHTADVEDITMLMYGAAVGILAQCWLHGEALRRWHNIYTQTRDEGERANESGGVLNPAILTIA
jgi:hypothetical protein